MADDGWELGDWLTLVAILLVIAIIAWSGAGDTSTWTNEGFR